MVDTKQRIVFISYLRIIAMFMVFYPHIVAYLIDNGFSRRLAYYILNPLHIIQFMGAFGVSLFFICSGYLAIREIGKGIYIYRFLKNIIFMIVQIFFCIMFVYLLLICIDPVINIFYNNALIHEHSFSDWLQTALLYSNFVNKHSMEPVLWFLIPFLIFRILIIIFDFVTKGSKEYILICFYIYFLISYFLFSENYQIVKMIQTRSFFIGIIIIGYIFALFHNRHINEKKYCIYLFINISIMLIGVYKRGYAVDDGYIVTVIYASILFLCFYMINCHLSANKFIEYSDRIGIIFFCFHNNIGKTVLFAMYNGGINKYICFVLSLCFVVFISLLYFKFFHNYINSYGRKILKIVKD